MHKQRFKIGYSVISWKQGRFFLMILTRIITLDCGCLRDFSMTSVVTKFHILAKSMKVLTCAYAHVLRAWPTFLACIYRWLFPFAALFYRELAQVLLDSQYISWRVVAVI